MKVQSVIFIFLKTQSCAGAGAALVLHWCCRRRSCDPRMSCRTLLCFTCELLPLRSCCMATSRLNVMPTPKKHLSPVRSSPFHSTPPLRLPLPPPRSEETRAVASRWPVCLWGSRVCRFRRLARTRAAGRWFGLFTLGVAQNTKSGRSERMGLVLATLPFFPPLLFLSREKSGGLPGETGALYLFVAFFGINVVV